MKKQEKHSIRTDRRRAFAWIACFVVLFAGLAMPMTPTMPRPQSEQLVWGNGCSNESARGIPLIDARTHQVCGCCFGRASLVALPPGMGLGFVTLVEPIRFPTAIVIIHAPKRPTGPNLNPRASPRV